MGQGEPHIRIHKWDELQHYKDREPPWIKLYNRLLDHYEFGRLPDAVKAHWLGLLMLRSRHGEPLPLDVDWMASRINATEPLDLRPLVSAGLIKLYHHDSARLAQDASNSQAFARSREAETETEERQSTEGSSLRSSPSGEAAVENSRDALCGAIREHGWVNGTPKGWSMGREVSVADSLDHDYGELVEAVKGLRLMVRRGNEAVEGFIAPGDSFTLRCFARQEERGMPLVKLARHAWRKWGDVEDDRSPRYGGELEHVGASVVAGEDP